MVPVVCAGTSIFLLLFSYYTDKYRYWPDHVDILWPGIVITSIIVAVILFVILKLNWHEKISWKPLFALSLIPLTLKLVLINLPDQPILGKISLVGNQLITPHLLPISLLLLLLNIKKYSLKQSAHSTKGGFTLVEVLVSLAIVVLLVSLLLPILKYAKIEGYKAEATQKLHQIHIALSLYKENNEAYPPYNLDPLITNGLLPSGYLLLKTDPAKVGFAKRMYECVYEADNPNIPVNESSFEDVFVLNPNPSKNSQLYLDEFLYPIDSNPGLVATRIFGTSLPHNLQSCGGLPAAYEGLVLRVREDGSVERGKYLEELDDKQKYCYPAVFTNIAPNIVCKRN